MLKEAKGTIDFLQKKIGINPRIGIILGTGLGNLVEKLDIIHTIDYKEIPHFPVSTVDGHTGRLIVGTLASKTVIAMQGRFHYYEGYTMQQVTFPVRIMRLLGIDHLILSNASGGVNPRFNVGDLMIIEDHINLMPNPLIGKNMDEWGPRFPDMSGPYNLELINKARQLAKKLKIKVRSGCYVGTTGPTFETPKEYQYFRKIGGDAVGMSTVPEVIVARHMGISCFAISVITDLGIKGKIKKVSHEEVQEAAALAEPKMTLLISELVACL